MPVVVEAERGAYLHGTREIGIGKDDIGRLTAKLLGDRLTLSAASFATEIPARVEPVNETIWLEGDRR